MAVFTFLLYSAVSDLQNNKFQPNYASGVSKIGIIFQLLAQISVTYIIYIVNIQRSGKILSSIEDIKKIDEMFGDLGESINYRKHFIFEISILLLGFAVIFGRSAINNFYMEVMTRILFGLVNKLLDNLIQEKHNQKCWKIKPSQEYYLKHALKRTELLMEIHDYLIDVGNKLNDSFTIQILSCFTAQFLTEVFTVFYVYYESLSKNTGVTIHKVLMNENDTAMKRKLMIFSQQVSHRPLQFTACGLFPIDATLIFTIAGAAATYLLIMLQFQEGVEAQCSNNITIN
ncbi:7tm 7 domain containing protein [Asbolus verrucosus]|uniref:7tm 7 domain containing protein n=1 Tax=Asbolus verrucosus TaxID=1661398 RepID=A0A482VX38_ASBVE|nr:7tm 7 domain containing protein [Asbolus verrucosus]